MIIFAWGINDDLWVVVECYENEHKYVNILICYLQLMVGC